MFKWKAAEKLAQPKITEVIAGDELLTTAIVEEAEPSPLPIAEPLADIIKPSVADEGANSSSEAQMPVALPPKEPAADLGVTAAIQNKPEVEFSRVCRYNMLDNLMDRGIRVANPLNKQGLHPPDEHRWRLHL